MDLVHERAVGIDISKRDAKVCVRRPAKRKGQFTSTVTTWGSTTNDILKLCQFIVDTQARCIVLTLWSRSTWRSSGRAGTQL